jgi:hypothetical protein
MNPYLDLYGFLLRTTLMREQVLGVEQRTPGFVEQSIASFSSEINAGARKRYGNAGAGRNALPFGRVAPPLISQGINPPAVQLVGTPVLGSMRIWLQVLVGGPSGTATFAWSSNGGILWTPNTPAALLAGAGVGVTIEPTVLLGTTGLSAIFPSGSTFTAGNIYRAETPVPEVILSWLTRVVACDVWMKVGANPQDPGIVMYQEEKLRCLKRLEDAANGKDGLLDIPQNEDSDSAVTTGGVMSSSQASPYVWTDIEERAARNEDRGFY